MIGHSLRKDPGLRPQMTWTFVQAPLGQGQFVVFCWRGEQGVIYMSRQQFNRLQKYPFIRQYVTGVAERIEYYKTGPHVEVHTLPEGDEREITDAAAVTRFLDRAAAHPVMRDDAFVIFSLIAKVDPDVEVPFMEWAEQLPVAI